MDKVVYTPEGGSARSWPISIENPAWDLAYNTEKETGWPWAEFCQQISKGSVIALRALIWTLRKRDEPRLDVESVMPLWAEVDLVEDEAVETEPEGERPGEA